MGIVFIILAVVAVVAGIGVISVPNPVYSALSLILVMFCLAIFYLLLHAPFIAAIQVLVYAGAIMVLFLFVITLLNPENDTVFSGRDYPWQRGVAILVGILLTIGLALLVGGSALSTNSGTFAQQSLAPGGNVSAFGRELFTTFLFPFEVTSFLLVVAIVGAVVLGKRQSFSDRAGAVARSAQSKLLEEKKGEAAIKDYISKSK